MGHVLVGSRSSTASSRPGPPIVSSATGSVHASIVEGGQEYSSYPERCLLQAERRTIPGERVADVEREIAALLGDVPGSTTTRVLARSVRDRLRRGDRRAAPAALRRRRAGRRLLLGGLRPDRGRRHSDRPVRPTRRGRARGRGVGRARGRSSAAPTSTSPSPRILRLIEHLRERSLPSPGTGSPCETSRGRPGARAPPQRRRQLGVRAAVEPALPGRAVEGRRGGRRRLGSRGAPRIQNIVSPKRVASSGLDATRKIVDSARGVRPDVRSVALGDLVCAAPVPGDGQEERARAGRLARRRGQSAARNAPRRRPTARAGRRRRRASGAS